MMKVDVLFINPGNQKRTYQELSKEYTAVATPVWTCLIADYLRRKDFEVAIYDINVDGWDSNVISELASKYNPRLTVLMVYGHQPSASTQSMSAAIQITNDIKSFNNEIIVAVGGTHPSALPYHTLEETKADYVIKGEGPYTIEGLITYLKGSESLSNVKGICYFKNGEKISNEPAPLVKNLDEDLNGYAWDLLPSLSHYRAHNMHCFQDFKKSFLADFSDIRSPYVTMNTSLGCPYSCHYCCINAIFGKPGIRYWSLDIVMQWIDTLVSKYKIRNIRFDDELFILAPKRVEHFCDMIIQRGYDLNFWVYGRVDTIKDSMLKKLKKAGVNWICLGIESANKDVRKNVNKKINAQISDIVKSIQAHDIYVLGNYMFGLPEDDLNTMKETLDYAMELNCEFANFYSAMAYPGSKLYDWAKEKKYEVPSNWSSFSQHGYETQPLPTNHISASDVLRFRDTAFIRYHTNPRYLDMISSRFGRKVREHIEKLLKIKVKRRLLGD